MNMIITVLDILQIYTQYKISHKGMNYVKARLIIIRK